MRTNGITTADAPTTTKQGRHSAPLARALRRARRILTAVSLTIATALGSLGTFTNAAAQSVNLDIERGAHPTTVSNQNGGAYLEYDVKASGSTRFFCGPKTSGGGTVCNDGGSNARLSDDAHTMNYAVEITWEKPLREVSQEQIVTTGSDGGLERKTVGGLNAQNSRNGHVSGPLNANLYWDRFGPLVNASEHHPLLATMTLVAHGTEYNVGPNNTLRFAVNPQISVENDEATEGTDTHLIFNVTLLPPALETTTADYGTQGASATGGGVDFTDTNGTLTWTAGESIKKVRVPIIDDSVSDGGEEMLLQLTNASGVTRFVDSNGDFQAAGLGAIGTINNDEPSDDLNRLTCRSSASRRTRNSRRRARMRASRSAAPGRPATR